MGSPLKGFQKAVIGVNKLMYDIGKNFKNTIYYDICGDHIGDDS